MKRYNIICLFLLAVVAFSSCSQGNEVKHRMTPAEKAEQHRKDSLALKVGVLQTADCLPAFVARDEGIFDSLGVDVRLVRYTSMLDYDEALKKKKLNGVFSDSKYIKRLTDKEGIRMQNVKTFDMCWQLVANRRSRLRRPGQLKDKIIAMSRYSVTDFLCDRLVDSVKLSSERVFRVQVNSVDTRLSMLLNNEIDAAWLPEPQASVAIQDGNNVLMRSDGRGEHFAVLSFSDSSLSDSRIKKQIDAFEKAYDLALKRIDKGGKKYYNEIIKKYYKYNLKR